MRVNEVDDSLDLNTFLIKIYKTDKEKEQIETLISKYKNNIESFVSFNMELLKSYSKPHPLIYVNNLMNELKRVINELGELDELNGLDSKIENMYFAGVEDELSIFHIIDHLLLINIKDINGNPLKLTKLTMNTFKLELKEQE